MNIKSRRFFKLSVPSFTFKVFFNNPYGNIILAVNMLFLFLNNLIGFAGNENLGIIGMVAVSTIFSTIFMIIPTMDGAYNSKYPENSDDLKKGIIYLLIFNIIMFSLFIFFKNHEINPNVPDNKSVHKETVYTPVNSLYSYDSHVSMKDTDDLEKQYSIRYFDAKGNILWDMKFSNKTDRDNELKSYFENGNLIIINQVDKNGITSLEFGKIYK